MKKQFLALLFAACTLIFGASMAHAKKPLDVDCVVLAATLEAVDDVLDAAVLDGTGTDFPNLGQLVSQSKKDSDLYDTLRFLVSTFSGGAINFAENNPNEVVPTIAGCGQIPLLIELINN